MSLTPPPSPRTVYGPPAQPDQQCDECPTLAVATGNDEDGGQNDWHRCLRHLIRDLAPDALYEP